LPWHYRFVETYARVAMVVGIVVATLALLFYVGSSVLVAFMSGEGILAASLAFVAAVILYGVAVLGILLASALMLTIVDAARHLRALHRIAEERNRPPPGSSPPTK
jgi:hypothetical protein